MESISKSEVKELTAEEIVELTGEEVDAVSGGNMFNVIGAFRLGWDIGSYIDQRFIKPMW